MSQVTQFGNFLQKSEVDKAEYKYYQNYIKLFLSVCLIFTIVGVIAEIIAVGYAFYEYRPISYNKEKFAEAQKINNDLKSKITLINESRPTGLNVIAVMAAITEAKPQDVLLSTIDISEQKTVIIGKTANIDTVNTFNANILLPGYNASVNSIKTDNKSNTHDFLIQIEKIRQSKKASVGGGKNG